MSDERLRQLYQLGIERRDGGGGVACQVPPEELLALVRGELPEERRLELFDRVMSSERCRSEFELLRSVEMAGRELASDEDADADEETGERSAPVVEETPATTIDPVLPPPPPPAPEPEPERELSPGVVSLDERRGRRDAPARRRPWWLRTSVPVALAATALVAVGLSEYTSRDEPAADVMRGSGDGVVAVSPAAELVAGSRPEFVWRAVPGASGYAFEVLDADGNLLHEAATADTVVVLPAGVALQPGTDYRWIVRATDDAGSTRASAVHRLRILDAR